MGMIGLVFVVGRERGREEEGEETLGDALGQEEEKGGGITKDGDA